MWENRLKKKSMKILISVIKTLGGSDGKESACSAEDPGWVGKILWRREWQPAPVFLPGESHRWRSLVGYSPWGRKESDRTE